MGKFAILLHDNNVTTMASLEDVSLNTIQRIVDWHACNNASESQYAFWNMDGEAGALEVVTETWLLKHYAINDETKEKLTNKIVALTPR